MIHAYDFNIEEHDQVLLLTIVTCVVIICDLLSDIFIESQANRTGWDLTALGFIIAWIWVIAS